MATRRWRVTLGVCCLFGASFGADEAPPSAFKPWSPPDLGKYEKELVESSARRTKGDEGIEIDPEKTYELQELIDIAERANPKTRIAWEHACQAAAAVGLSRSVYFPSLVATAGAGYERAFVPFPSLAVG